MVLLAIASATYPGGVSGPLFLAGALTLAPSCVAGIAALVVRWRRAEGLVRRQIAVLLVTAGVLVVDTLLQPLLAWPVDALSQAVAVALVPAGHRRRGDPAPALRPRSGRLPGDRRSGLAVSLAAIYVSLFLLASAVLPGGPTVGATTAAAVCGLLLHPLGVRLNRGVDRMFYGDRADPARRPRGRPPPGCARVSTSPRYPRGSARCVVESLRLGSAADPSRRWIGRGAPLAAVGTPNGPATQPADEAPRRGRRHPARHRPRRGDEPAHPRRRAAGHRVRPGRPGRRRAAALRPAPTEPRRDRDRPRGGTAPAPPRPARRRRRSAGRRTPAGRDRPRPGRRPGRQRPARVRGHRRRHRRRRRTSHHRRPTPAGAGRPRARRRPARPRATGWPRRAPRIDVDVDVHGSLPAAVEVACYRIAAEALANACGTPTHAGSSLHLARHHHGPVARRSRTTGSACPSGRRAGGLGLASMRQRAEEIGGALTVTSTAAGTAVRAELPMEAPMTRDPARRRPPAVPRRRARRADRRRRPRGRRRGRTTAPRPSRSRPSSAPDVVLMDLNLPDVSGVDATGAHPGRGARDIRVLMMTMSATTTPWSPRCAPAHAGYVVKGAGRERAAARDPDRRRRRSGVQPDRRRPARAGSSPGWPTGAGQQAFPQLTDRERGGPRPGRPRPREPADRPRRCTSRTRPCATTCPTCSPSSTVEDRSEAIARARAAGLGG